MTTKKSLSFLVLVLAVCVLPIKGQATEIEATLKPLYTHPSSDRHFIAPLEEVGFIFDRCIKLYDDASVEVKCDGEVVAEAVEFEIDNYDGELGKQGTLIARFDKQLLPKGKTYTVCLAKGSVGWVECYNDIQIVNRAYSFDMVVPENLGAPASELGVDFPVEDSECLSLSFYYGYEIAPVGNPMFLFYREGELVDEIPVHVSWDWDLGYVRPQFPEKTNFDLGVRYSLVLPAGSVSSLYREDIVNEEYSMNFIGYYTEPDTPVSYQWCSLFTNHSDVLNEVSFTYGSPVGVTDDAVIELYEGDCETLVKAAPAYLKTEVNCWLVCCDFEGFRMTSEKGYTIVVPDDAVYLQQFPDVKATGGKVRVSGSSGISDVVAGQNDDTPVYDMTGRVVKNPVPGSLYIKNGIKFIYRQR